MTHGIAALAGKDSGDSQYAGFGAQRSRSHAFFHAGDAQPLGPCANHCGRANAEGMAVGVGLDNGQQLRMGRGQGGKKPVVIFKEVGANLNPAGTCWHLGVQALV